MQNMTRFEIFLYHYTFSRTALLLPFIIIISIPALFSQTTTKDYRWKAPAAEHDDTSSRIPHIHEISASRQEGSRYLDVWWFTIYILGSLAWYARIASTPDGVGIAVDDRFVECKLH